MASRLAIIYIFLVSYLHEVCYSELASDVECLNSECAQVELLQHSLARSNEHARENPREHVSPYNISVTQPLPVPLHVLEIPKCGSTLFITTVLLFPGVCELSPENHTYVVEHVSDGVMQDYTYDSEADADLGGASEPDFLTSCALSSYTGYTDHSGIDDIYDSEVKGHGFVMLRQPEQRIISGYLYDYHSWPLFEKDMQWPKNILEYADVLSGCSVKQLTRSGRSYLVGFQNTVCGSPTPVTDAEIALAIKRLNEGFVFVGITENYTLSVCLMIAKFGGECKTDIFTGTWPLNVSTEPYNSSYLGSWTDDRDGPLYREAQRIFERDLRLYGVTEQSCNACLRQADASSVQDVEVEHQHDLH